MKKVCADCIKEDEHPIRYALGKCSVCGTYNGVVEVESKKYDMPPGFEELFGNLKK